MNNIDYHDKYLKYKNKYLELKKQQGGYIFNPNPGDPIIVEKMFKEPGVAYLAYFVTHAPIFAEYFLIRGKIKGIPDKCSDNGWVVHRSFIKNRTSMFDFRGNRNKINDWLDTSKLPLFDDKPYLESEKTKVIQAIFKDKVKFYMHDKDLVDMFDKDGKIVCYGGSHELDPGDPNLGRPSEKRCIIDEETLYNDTRTKEMPRKDAVKNARGDLICKEQICIENKTFIKNYNNELIESNQVIGNHIFEYSDYDTTNYLKPATCLTDGKMEIK